MSIPTALMTRARAAARPQVTGSVSGAMGLTMTVDGLSAAVGDLVEVNPGERGLLAEVVAVGRDRLTCMPLGTLSGIHAGAPVRATGMPLQVPVGEALLGRVIDGLGRPLDGGPPLGSRVSYVKPHGALYNRAFTGTTRFGYAAAVGLVLFLFIFAVTLVQRLLFGKAEVS